LNRSEESEIEGLRNLGEFGREFIGFVDSTKKKRENWNLGRW